MRCALFARPLWQILQGARQRRGTCFIRSGAARLRSPKALAPRTGLELCGKGRAGEVILSGKQSAVAEMLNAIYEADFLDFC